MKLWQGIRDNRELREIIIIVAKDEDSAYKQFAQSNRDAGIAEPKADSLREIRIDKEGIRIISCIS